MRRGFNKRIRDVLGGRVFGDWKWVIGFRWRCWVFIFGFGVFVYEEGFLFLFRGFYSFYIF